MQTILHTFIHVWALAHISLASRTAYIPDDITLLNDSSILNMIPISTGGQIGSWSISPEPSTGLTFDTLTGIFSGTPTETKVRTEYQITATNGVGVDVVKVNITIEEFDYSLPLSPIYLLEKIFRRRATSFLFTYINYSGATKT